MKIRRGRSMKDENVFIHTHSVYHTTGVSLRLDSQWTNCRYINFHWTQLSKRTNALVVVLVLRVTLNGIRHSSFTDQICRLFSRRFIRARATRNRDALFLKNLKMIQIYVRKKINRRLLITFMIVTIERFL